MANNLNPDIFLSYSWANKNVADEIDDTFKSVGILFRRDVRDAPYLANIKDFMHQAGKTKFVLMIISDEYLRSENCMYEVIELLNTHDFEKRVLPVVIDNATAIFRVPKQVMYYEYWEKQVEEAEALKKRHANAATIEYADKCHSINRYLPIFFQRITELNVSSYKTLKEKNYRDLLNIVGFNDKKTIEEVIGITKSENPKLREKTFLNKHLDNKYALFNKAISADKRGLYSEAKKNYEAAIKADPNFAFAHNNLAILLRNNFSDYEGAREHYEAAIKINPNFAFAHNNLAKLLRNNFSDYKGAKEHYEMAIEIDPNFANAYNNLAILLADNFSDYQGAKKHHEAAIKIEPSNNEIRRNYAILLKNNFSEYEGAKEHYEAAIKNDLNDAESHNNLATLLRNYFSDYEGAKEHYEAAIKINPNFAFAHFNLAILLRNNFSDHEGAREHYETAIKIDPNFAEAHNNLAVLLEGHFFDYTAAKMHFERAIEINSEYTLAKNNLKQLLETHFKS